MLDSVDISTHVVKEEGQGRKVVLASRKFKEGESILNPNRKIWAQPLDPYEYAGAEQGAKLN